MDRIREGKSVLMKMKAMSVALVALIGTLGLMELSQNDAGPGPLSSAAWTNGATPLDVALSEDDEGVEGSPEACEPQELETRIWSDHVVISEFASEGWMHNDEFVELYNPTEGDIDIGGWEVQYSATTTTSWYSNGRVVPLGTILPSHRFYLMAYDGNDGDGGEGYDPAQGSGPEPDLWWGDAYSFSGDYGSMRLIDDLGATVDLLGYGIDQGSSHEKETSTFEIAWGTNPCWQSAERKATPDSTPTSMAIGGLEELDGNGEDSGNNALDFVERAMRQPQSLAGGDTEPSGPDLNPPVLSRATTVGRDRLIAYFNEEVNETDVENIDHWKIVKITGYDTTPPTVAKCYSSGLNEVIVQYSETVNETDATNQANYAFDKGLTITGALSLDAGMKEVTIPTSGQSLGETYTLAINNINDTSTPPNVIEPNTQASFSGGGMGGDIAILFLNVGQGDATFIKSSTGKSALIDGGPTGEGAGVVSTITGAPYNIVDLNYTFATHYHEDHIGSLDEVISSVGLSPVDGTCYDRGESYGTSAYDEYETSVSGYRQTMTKGQVVDLGGGLTITCLGLNGNGISVSDENDKSLILRVDYLGFNMYIAGDVGGGYGIYENVEGTVMGDVGQVEVYQVDHHGSYGSSNTPFMAEIDPVISVFSVGQAPDNSYGHVHQEAFDRIKPYTDYMYYTNPGEGALPADVDPPTTPGIGEGKIMNGDIILRCTGNRFNVSDAYSGGSFSHEFYCHGESDSTPPTLIGARTVDQYHVSVIFDEAVEPGSGFGGAENADNYLIDGGLGVPSAAVLNPLNPKEVTLTTPLHTDGWMYNITVNNVNDTSGNTIAPNSKVQFVGGEDLLPIISVEQNPLCLNQVNITTATQERAGYEITAYFINDTAEPANMQASTSVVFVGGGPHLGINEILYDFDDPEYGSYDDDKEWWEIYNPTEEEPMNIKSWKFKTLGYYGNTVQLPPEDLVIPNGSHATFAVNGQEFQMVYGYYPDFEIFGATPAKDIGFSDMADHSTLANTNDCLVMYNSNGQMYDAVAWGGTYLSLVYAPDVSGGRSLKRTNDGWEGPETPKGGSPTGADEGTENLAVGVFGSASPRPDTLDSMPPNIVDLQVEVGSNFAHVTWNTTDGEAWPEINPHADSTVIYSPEGDPDTSYNVTVSYASLVTDHGVTLYPLLPSTPYYYYVTSTDGKGQTNRSGTFQFTTLGADATPPAISGVGSKVTDTTATVSWTTNEKATSMVRYGLSTSTMENYTGERYLSTDHEILLHGLEPVTPHWYEVYSEDSSGNGVWDGPHTFTTDPQATMGFYLANMDAFTSYSNGATGYPSTAYSYADDRIDVLGLNDHSNQLEPIEYSDGKFTASLYTTGSFVGLYGQQLWGANESYGAISAYNESEIATGNSLDHLDYAYQWLKDHGAIGVFSLAGSEQFFNDFAYNESADQNMAGLQILSGGELSGYPDDITRYEDYYNLALRSGWHVGPIAGQRNYAGNWGNKPNLMDKIDLTVIKAPSLSQANVIAALDGKSFYAFEADAVDPLAADPVITDIILLNFSINGHEMGSEFTTAGNLKFMITLDADNPFYLAEVYEDGNVIRSEYYISDTHFEWCFEYTPVPGEHYYYVRAEQSYLSEPVGNASMVWSSPIWVEKPSLYIPDYGPEFGWVEYEPASPGDGEQVVVTVPVTDDVGLQSVLIRYSLDSGASWHTAPMNDLGLGSDAAQNDTIYTGVIPGQSAGTHVEFYIEAVDTGGNAVTKPAAAPVSTYGYYVGARLLIDKVCANPDWTYEDQELSEWIELYNPTGSSIDISGYILQDEYFGWFADEWAFPAGTTLPSGQSVIATRSVVAFNDNYSVSCEVYEYYDSDLNADNDMVPVNGGYYEINLYNGEDAVYLKDPEGVIIDCMEWGVQGVAVPGDPAKIPNDNFDVHVRDVDHTDTDNSAFDFIISNGVEPATNSINNQDTAVLDVRHSTPLAGSPVYVEFWLKFDGDSTTPQSVTMSMNYRVNGGGWTGATGGEDAGRSLPSQHLYFYNYTIPGQSAGTGVDYYIHFQKGQTVQFDTPSDYANYPYGYTVEPGVVISEVFYDTEGYGSCEFIELYNRGSTAVNIGGWSLQDENYAAYAYYEMSWATRWQFPTGTTIQPYSTIVVAKTPEVTSVTDSDYSTDFLSVFGFLPDFEFYDADITSYKDYDSAGTPDMVQVTLDTYDNQVRLDDAHDAVYLKSGSRMVDYVEWGIDGYCAAGREFGGHYTFDTGCSLTRDVYDLVDDYNTTGDYHVLQHPTPGRVTTYITLSEGWDLISLGLNQTDAYHPIAPVNNVEGVLDDLMGSSFAPGFDAVQWYDASAGEWRHWANNTGKWYGTTLDGLNYEQGLLIKLAWETTLVVSGWVANASAPCRTYLHEGWNLVGYGFLAAMDPATALGPSYFTGSYDRVEVRLEGGDYAVPATMRPREGYWIHVPAGGAGWWTQYN